MRNLFATSLIAIFVSTGVLAQQAEEKTDAAVDTSTQGAENAIGETEAATENMAQEAEALGTDMVTDRPMLRNPSTIVREGYRAIEPIDMTAENLTGARVYGANDEDIGEIDELLLSSDGARIDQVVVDVGGFLGMGEHEVAVTMEELHIMRSEDGTEIRAYMDATEEELEAQPEYDG